MYEEELVEGIISNFSNKESEINFTKRHKDPMRHGLSPSEIYYKGEKEKSGLFVGEWIIKNTGDKGKFYLSDNPETLGELERILGELCFARLDIKIFGLQKEQLYIPIT